MRELRFLNNPNDAIRVRDNDFEILQTKSDIIAQVFDSTFDPQYKGIHSKNKVITPITFQLQSEDVIEISREDTAVIINGKIYFYESNTFEVQNPAPPDQQRDQKGNRWFCFVPNPTTTSTPRPTLLGNTFNRVTHYTCQIKRLQDCTLSELNLCVPFWINSDINGIYGYDYPKPFIPFYKPIHWVTQNGYEIEAARIGNQVFIKGKVKIGQLIPTNNTQPYTTTLQLPDIYRPTKEVIVNTKSSTVDSDNWAYYAEIDSAIGINVFGNLIVRTSDWNTLQSNQRLDTQFEISYFV